MKPIEINFNDLNGDSQKRLLEQSKKDVESKFGKSIRDHAKTHLKNYDKLLEEEAIRNLYNLKYRFSV